MKFQFDDGGRVAAGFKGSTGDCVVRAVAIATGLPYQQVYDALAAGNANERRTRRAASGKRTARRGISTGRKWFKDYMLKLGWKWTPTMGIGTGCKVHLTDGELPMGRLIVAVSRHYTAVIDDVIHDTHDPQRATDVCELSNRTELKPGEWRNINGIWHTAKRCVYGYWSPI